MKNSRRTYGQGTVYKQGTSYVSQLMCTIDIDGELYSKRITGSGKTETAAVRNRNKNAQNWEKKLRQQLEVVLQPEIADTQEVVQTEEEKKTELTLNQVFHMNLALKDASIQISSSDNYSMYYESYVEKAPIGRMAIQEITEEMLVEFYKDVKINGRKRGSKKKDGQPIQLKPLSISTVNHIRFVVNNTFQYAAAKGIISHNPHLNIAPFKAGTAAMVDYEAEDMDEDSDEVGALERVVPLEDVDRILEYAFKQSRLAGLFAWAFNSGMRQGECLGLKRINAEPQKGYVFVKKSLTYIRRRNSDEKRKVPMLKKPKNGKERKVPYNNILKEIFDFQLQRIKEEKKQAGHLYNDKGLLFADEYGDFLRPWRVLKEFQRILEAVGVKKHRFHDMRHTFVSLLVRESQKAGEGISILEVSAIVGHSDPTVTMKIYGGLFPNATERAMRILDSSNAIHLPISKAS